MYSYELSLLMSRKLESGASVSIKYRQSETSEPVKSTKSNACPT